MKTLVDVSLTEYPLHLHSLGIISSRDLRTFNARYNNEGIGFLKCVSEFLKDILSGLDSGKYTPSESTTRSFSHRNVLPGFLLRLTKYLFDKTTGFRLETISASKLRDLKQFCKFFKRLTVPNTQFTKEAWDSLKASQDMNKSISVCTLAREHEYDLELLRNFFQEHYQFSLPSESSDQYVIKFPSKAIRERNFVSQQHDDVVLQNIYRTFNDDFIYDDSATFVKYFGDATFCSNLNAHNRGFDEVEVLIAKLHDYYNHVYYQPSNYDIVSGKSDKSSFTGVHSSHYKVSSLWHNVHKLTNSHNVSRIDWQGKFASVPKDAEKDRGISVFQFIYQTIMLMVNRAYYSNLRSNTPLKDQSTIHKRLLSNFEHIATIDLSSATDRASDSVYSYLLEGNKFRDMLLYLNAFDIVYRSKDTCDMYELTAQTMGQGIGSFDRISSLVTAVSKVAVCKHLDPQREFDYNELVKQPIFQGYNTLISSYGDDIHTPFYDSTCDLLKLIGHSPNMKKSFSTTSWFKESCGLDLVKESKSAKPICVTTQSIPNITLVPTANGKIIKKKSRINSNTVYFMRSCDVVRCISVAREAYESGNIVMSDFLVKMVEKYHYKGTKTLPNVNFNTHPHLVGRPAEHTDNIYHITARPTRSYPSDYTLSSWSHLQSKLREIHGSYHSLLVESALTSTEKPFNINDKGDYVTMAKSRIKLQWDNKMTQLENEVLAHAANRVGLRISDSNHLRSIAFDKRVPNNDLLIAALDIVDKVIELLPNYL